MKLKVFHLGLGWLMFIFLSAISLWAAMDPKYNPKVFTPPHEHPWQHVDSPKDPGSGLEHESPSIVIVPVLSTIKPILLIHTPSGINGSGKKVEGAKASEGSKQNFNGLK